MRPQAFAACIASGWRGVSTSEQCRGSGRAGEAAARSEQLNAQCFRQGAQRAATHRGIVVLLLPATGARRTRGHAQWQRDRQSRHGRRGAVRRAGVLCHAWARAGGRGGRDIAHDQLAVRQAVASFEGLEARAPFARFAALCAQASHASAGWLLLGTPPGVRARGGARRGLLGSLQAIWRRVAAA